MKPKNIFRERRSRQNQGMFFFLSGVVVYKIEGLQYLTRGQAPLGGRGENGSGSLDNTCISTQEPRGRVLCTCGTTTKKARGCCRFTARSSSECWPTELCMRRDRRLLRRLRRLLREPHLYHLRGMLQRGQGVVLSRVLRGVGEGLHREARRRAEPGVEKTRIRKLGRGWCPCLGLSLGSGRHGHCSRV